jgi:hypothetical protein
MLDVKNHCKLLLPLNDYFTMLSMLVSSSQWRGRGKGREFTLPGNRQFKIQYQRYKNQIKTSKLKQSCYQFNLNKDKVVLFT